MVFHLVLGLAGSWLFFCASWSSPEVPSHLLVRVFFIRACVCFWGLLLGQWPNILREIWSSYSSLLWSLFAVLHHRRYIAQALHQRAWVQDIDGTLTAQVLLDFVHVWELCLCWSNDGCYSSSSVYATMFIDSSWPLGAKQLWRLAHLQKLKNSSFLGNWRDRSPCRNLLKRTTGNKGKGENKSKERKGQNSTLHRRCWTAERRRRHGL